MNLKSVGSFVYSSLIMLFLVPGTLGRVLSSLHIPAPSMISNMLMLTMVFMTLFLIVVNVEKTVNIFYLFIGILILISFYKISVISGQPLMWRISGYILLIILILLFIFNKSNSMVSDQGLFWGIICFAIINAFVGIFQYFSQNVLLSSASSLYESTIRLNSNMWILGSSGTLRGFGFFSSGMTFGTIMVLGFSVLWYEKLKINKLSKILLLSLFTLATVTSLTKNVYIFYLLVIALKYIPQVIKFYVFFGGIFAQFLSGLFAVLLQNSSYFQSDFFATFRIRYTGLIYFQNYYVNDWQGIIFGHGFQYDSSYKNFTALALDNQLWALFFEGGILLIFVVYLLIYRSAFNKNTVHSSLTNILVLFGIFGISNNYITFFLGVAVLSNLLCNSNGEFSLSEDMKIVS
ncbi:hypothetical protein [Leuconostoc suionicum]|uniref:hypothetical protein n=1 Tax=Leuconostoc suionicum TaxID=1511761 RepID=UPI0021A664E5|nr:hypothetical protein [Leuconostoc suionicum]